ncbi:MAG TPA: hypothetical protein VGL09_04335 [Methylomirabilota bacterium]
MNKDVRLPPAAISTRDLAIVAAAWFVAYAVHFYALPALLLTTRRVPPFSDYLVQAPVVLTLWLVAAYAVRSLRRVWSVSAAGRIGATATLAAMLVFVWLRIVLAGAGYARGAIVSFWLLSLVAVLVSRRVAPETASEWSAEPLAAVRAALISTLGRGLATSWRREATVAGLAVLVLAVDCAQIAWRTDFIPCTLDCGETYESYIGALNLHRFGLAHMGGLQDFAASPRPAAHGTIYTHNPNLGLYVRYLLFRLGVEDVHAQAGWFLVPFALGLLYMYLFLRSATGDGTLAAFSLLNASTLYLLVTLWGFHGLRVFTWLLTFAPAYHLWHYSRAASRGRLHLVAATTFLALSFGVDYPFAVFNGANVVVLTALGVLRLRLRPLAGILVVSFGVPFLLRQVQVAAVVGVDFWFTDVVLSMLRRIAIAGFFVTLPDEATLRALYATHHILKWPDPSAFEPLQWGRRLVRVYADVLGAPFIGLVLLWAAIPVLLGRGGASEVGRRGGGPALAAARVIVGVMAAQALTFVLFGGYFVSFYGESLSPLLVHWIVPLLGCTMWLVWANAGTRVRWGQHAVPVGAVLLVLFVGWRAAAEIRARTELPPAGYPGRAVLAGLHGHSVVTFWISSAVAAYTHEWAAVLHEPRWRIVHATDLPFDPVKDYYFFFEIDTQDARYGWPEFLFVPAINIPWLVDRHCTRFDGHIGSPVDGCTGLDGVADRLTSLPLVARGPEYLLYDLRPLRAAGDRRGGSRNPAGADASR